MELPLKGSLLSSKLVIVSKDFTDGTFQAGFLYTTLVFCFQKIVFIFIYFYGFVIIFMCCTFYLFWP